MFKRANRRSFLKLGGASVVVAFAGGVLSAADFAGVPLPEGDAYAPWRLCSDPAIRNTPLALVSFGILAANPHDTQAWLFHVGDDAVEMFADTSRNLGAMDPDLREMHLGLGCAIENMLTAAGPNGYEAQLETVPGSLTGFSDRAARRRSIAGAPDRHRHR